MAAGVESGTSLAAWASSVAVAFEGAEGVADRVVRGAAPSEPIAGDLAEGAAGDTIVGGATVGGAIVGGARSANGSSKSGNSGMAGRASACVAFASAAIARPVAAVSSSGTTIWRPHVGQAT